MSDQQQPQQDQSTPTQPSEPQSSSPPDRIAAALAAAERSIAEESAPPPQAEAAPAAPTEAPPPAEAEKPKSDAWARVAELDKQNRELRSKLKEQVGGEDIAALAKQDLGKAFEKLGVTFDDIVDYWSKTTTPAEPEAPKDVPVEVAPYVKKIETLEKELSAFKQDWEQHQRNAFIQREKSEYSRLAAGEKDRWEAVHEYSDDGSYELCLQVAAEMFNLNKQLPAHEEVLDAVESKLVEMAQRQREKVQRLKKLAPREEAYAKAVQKQQQESRPVANGSPETPAPRELTREERVQRAIQLLDKQQ